MTERERESRQDLKEHCIQRFVQDVQSKMSTVSYIVAQTILADSQF